MIRDRIMIASDPIFFHTQMTSASTPHTLQIPPVMLDLFPLFNGIIIEGLIQ